MRNTRPLLFAGALAALYFATSRPANATIIAEHSGATNPSTEGFKGGFGSAVTNDLGLGINAWNVGGNWCCTDDFYDFTAAQTAEVAASNWIMTIDFRDLSTETSGNYGPNSYGSGVSVGFDGVRFEIDLHTDGKGGQILATDPFAAGQTYDLAGLGTNYVLISADYNAATKTADFYVNGNEVISGVTGFANYPFNAIGFGGGGLGGNFNLVELEIPSSAPEPSSFGPTTVAGIAALTLLGRRLKSRRML